MKTIGQDKTSYARTEGYTGTRTVVVLDGKVISHGRAEWFAWIRNERRKKQQRTTSCTTTA